MKIEKKSMKKRGFSLRLAPNFNFWLTQKSRFAKNERIRKKRDEIVELSEWLAPDIHDMAGIFDSSPILISHYRRSLYAPHFTLPIDELKGLLWYFWSSLLNFLKEFLNGIALTIPRE